jgi:hypothetical protein
LPKAGEKGRSCDSFQFIHLLFIDPMVMLRPVAFPSELILLPRIFASSNYTMADDFVDNPLFFTVNHHCRWLLLEWAVKRVGSFCRRFEVSY